MRSLPLPYDTIPQVGDTVVVIATPFLRWLQATDFQCNPDFHRRYRYDLLPTRPDQLDYWLWVESVVLAVQQDMAICRHQELGERSLPLNCLSVLKREEF